MADGLPGRIPTNCVVTGAAGLVGRRLVEMLVERGATRVVAFDLAPRPPDFDLPQVEWARGNLTNPDDVSRACRGADCVWHIGALVGPYFPKEAYGPVNYQGTIHVIDACRRHGVRKIIMASSPSTRYDGKPFRNVVGEDIPIRPPGQFLEPYAETKAQGEVALRQACCESLMTVAISPHQVYGPRDALFLTKTMQQAGKLRVFGPGDNEVSMVYVDNYCHALILGERALYPKSPALGKFYVVTDGPPVRIWDALDKAVTTLGYTSLKQKYKVPAWLMLAIAHTVATIGLFVALIPPFRNYVKKGQGPFKISPFAIRMMMIDRSFDISAARRDLGYEPLYTFDEAWSRTLQWFKENPKFWQK